MSTLRVEYGTVCPARPVVQPGTRARYRSGMFAVTAARVSPEDPLAAIDLGDRPEPSTHDGWVTVTVRAASLNHHDVWTLRGVGISADRLPIILGCDAAGVDPHGNEVIVHAVVGEGGAEGDETLDPTRSLMVTPRPRCGRSATTAR